MAVTPEEKLLKLIRRKREPVPPSARGKGGGPGAAKAHPDKKRDPVHLLDPVNVMLMLLSAGLAAYFAVNSFFFNRRQDVSLRVESGVSSGGTAVEAIGPPEPKPFHVYERKWEQRDLFEMPWERAGGEDGAIEETAVDLSAQLKVVGIVLDADPKAVVEDVKTKQTFFLSQGDSIAGAVLESILEDKVIFIYHNKTVEFVP